MLNSHQSAERAQRAAGSGSTRWRQSRHHKVSLKWAAADISRPPPRSLLGRAELARHPAASPHGGLKLAITAARAFHHLVLKLAPLRGSCFVPLTTKSTLRQPTASNRAACSNPASSFWYRTEQPSPPGLVRLDWRQSLHQTINVK